MKPRVLIIEDDASLALGIAEALKDGHEVTESRRGDAGLALLRKEHFDLVLLDLMLPGKNGYDVLQELRKEGIDTPVILVTAKGQEVDKVLGFRLGADDYVTKPFGVQELLARIGAVLRRSGSGPGRSGAAGASGMPETIRFGDVTVRTAALTGKRGNREFTLTRKELKVLAVLHGEAGRVVERARLLAEVWGDGYEGTDRALDQVILKLRAKVEREPGAPRHLRTVHAVGYRLDP